MYIICFTSNVLLGGYGDRIVGIISVKLIAQLMGEPFAILWTKEDIHKYINYTKYDYELNPECKQNLNNMFKEEEEGEGNNKKEQNLFFLIDNQTQLKDKLTTLDPTSIFTPNIHKYFFLNQEISQYLYKNPKYYGHVNYYNDIIHEYKTLYTDILKPTPELLNRIHSIIGENNEFNPPIIGIQLRCGDMFMETNKNDVHKHFTGISNHLEKIMNNIKYVCDLKYNKYRVFITADHNNAYPISKTIWNEKNIIYNNDFIQHLDRNPIQDDISKIFIDNYILSQKTECLYISPHSNYGRVSALSAVHDNIYSILTCEKINISTLLSKHELFENN